MKAFNWKPKYYVALSVLKSLCHSLSLSDMDVQWCAWTASLHTSRQPLVVRRELSSSGGGGCEGCWVRVGTWCPSVSLTSRWRQLSLRLSFSNEQKFSARLNTQCSQIRQICICVSLTPRLALLYKRTGVLQNRQMIPGEGHAGFFSPCGWHSLVLSSVLLQFQENPILIPEKYVRKKHATQRISQFGCIWIT